MGIYSPNFNHDLYQAILKNNVISITRLLIAKADAEQHCGLPEISMLEWAAIRNHAPAIRALVETGGADPNNRNAFHFTALGAATLHTNPEAIRELVNQKADVNGVLKLPSVLSWLAWKYDESTPLHWALWTKSSVCVRVLCELKADPHKKNKAGQTPVDWAKQVGDPCRSILMSAVPKLPVHDPC